MSSLSHYNVISLTLANGEHVRVNGTPYNIARIIEFLPPHTSPKKGSRVAPSSDVMVRLSLYYRPSDISARNVADFRLLLAAIHTDIQPISNIRGKCYVRHKDRIPDLLEWKRSPDHFYFVKFFDPYIKREFEVIRTASVNNDPEDAIFPRAATRVGSKYQANVPSWEEEPRNQESGLRSEITGLTIQNPSSILFERGRSPGERKHESTIELWSAPSDDLADYMEHVKRLHLVVPPWDLERLNLALSSYTSMGREAAYSFMSHTALTDFRSIHFTEEESVVFEEELERNGGLDVISCSKILKRSTSDILRYSYLWKNEQLKNENEALRQHRRISISHARQNRTLGAPSLGKMRIGDKSEVEDDETSIYSQPLAGTGSTMAKPGKSQSEVVVKFKDSEGVMSAGVWCKSHDLSGRVIHEIFDVEPDGGETAFQVYVGAYKSPTWNSTFPLLRKAKRLELVTPSSLKLEETETNVEKCDFCGVSDSPMWHKDIDRTVQSDAASANEPPRDMGIVPKTAEDGQGREEQLPLLCHLCWFENQN
ncbi:hypothetical protein AYX15_06876 [Cryptococcus neoformans]|nr:hypothetical protein AYX15_06876 [Cryptococcus neoformans var. grubii]